MLSVVIPVFNGEKFLQETLDSLEALDSLLSCEFIFQNNQSIDGTTVIVEAFCRHHANRFHYIESDSGQSDAINRGMARATGRWVTWLCADDVLLPEIVGALELGEQKGVDVVYGDVVFVHNGKLVPAIGTETYSPGILAKRRLVIQQPGTCFLRHVWLDAGGVQVHLNWAMDYDLFLRLEAKQKKFLRVQNFLAAIRIHPLAKTSSGSVRRVRELWRILWQSHTRTPCFFRLRPYTIYAVEYIIKRLEQAGPQQELGCKRLILAVLHRFFWFIATAQEQGDIGLRFQNLSADTTCLLRKLAVSDFSSVKA